MIQRDNFLATLYKEGQSVFTSKEIALLTRETDKDNLKSKIAYYVRTGKLARIRRGLFAKSDDFNVKECAVRLYVPAYVSFETVLRQEGIIFQYYDAVFVASYLSRKVSLYHTQIMYRKLKDSVLTNRSGLIDKGTFFEASKERAFLDVLYLNRTYFFDNLRSIDWEACFLLVDIYKKKSLTETLKKYKKQYAR